MSNSNPINNRERNQVLRKGTSSDKRYNSINIAEYRRGNQKWTIQRPVKHGTQDEDKQNKDTTQYELGATKRKQTHIT